MGMGRVLSAVTRGVVSLLIAAVLVIVGTFAAPTAAADVEDVVQVEFRFRPGCNGSGYVGFAEVGTDPRQGASERGVFEWGPDQPVVTEAFVASEGADVEVLLFDAELGATLFSGRPIPRDGSDETYLLSVTLDCSTIPYRVAMPETATARATDEGSQHHGLGAFGHQCPARSHLDYRTKRLATL